VGNHQTQAQVKEKKIREIFKISVFLKGLHALLELIGGFLLLFVKTSTITHFVISLTQEELTEDPDDLVANFLFQHAQNLSINSQRFAAFYLLSHGVIKLLLVAGLLRDKLWAYPSSMVVMGIFILYQMYRFTLTHSLGLVALSVFDVVLVWLVWHEYNLIKQQRN
jgi:uncharacterized membrane protein